MLRAWVGLWIWLCHYKNVTIPNVWWMKTRVQALAFREKCHSQHYSPAQAIVHSVIIGRQFIIANCLLTATKWLHFSEKWDVLMIWATSLFVPPTEMDRADKCGEWPRKRQITWWMRACVIPITLQIDHKLLRGKSVKKQNKKTTQPLPSLCLVLLSLCLLMPFLVWIPRPLSH